mmetsp:Transcript_14819/g.36328  ORF Transcript_14819/g.36328 Transcript_14819/m.36328 type:complete len:208 (-) Transcript_14819:1136-1759(-)
MVKALVQQLHYPVAEDEHMAADLPLLINKLCAAVGHRFEARAQFGDKDVVVQAPVTIHVEQRDLVYDVGIVVVENLASQMVGHLQQQPLLVVPLDVLLAEKCQRLLEALLGQVGVADEGRDRLYFVCVCLLAQVGVGHDVRHGADDSRKHEATHDHTKARYDPLAPGGRADVSVPHGGHSGEGPVHGCDVSVPDVAFCRFGVFEVHL